MLIQLPKITEQDHQLSWSNLAGSALSYALDSLIRTQQKPYLLITPTVQSAEQLIRELEFFSEKSYPVLRLPDWETLPFDHFSPHEDIISERLRTLYQLPTLKQGIVVCSITTLLHRLLPREFLSQNTLFLKVGDKLDFENYKLNLVNNGYRAVGQVLAHGEFAYRGSILDIFPMGFEAPLRIELFDNEIESMRTFDVDSQRSLEKINEIELLPAQEYPLDEAGVKYFREKWREKFSGNPMNSPLYQQISQATPASGSEYYLALFFNHLDSIFNYLPKNTCLLFANDVQSKAEQFWQEINERYEQLAHDIEKPILKPSEIYLSLTEFFTDAKPFTQIKLMNAPEPKANFVAPITELPNLQVDHRQQNPLKKLKEFIEDFLGKILICAESTGRRETLLDQLKAAEVFPRKIELGPSFLRKQESIHEKMDPRFRGDDNEARGNDNGARRDDNIRVYLTIAPLERGCIFSEEKIALICEADLYGAQVQQRRLRKKQGVIDPELMISNLNELKIGAPVVHLQHGVGRYLGLETISVDDTDAEYLSLEYADNTKIYVPVSSLDLISRYTGLDSEHAPLSKLGSSKWSRDKQKAYEKIRDVAAELLDVYSRRHETQGFCFEKPNSEYFRFAQAFAFETTPDQQKAIDDVIHDMTRINVMDRLVCGDVGFGKTEVAMRAAFLAVSSGKQVAVLVPTTLLATQHFTNFKTRFAEWPFKIALLSRSNTPKETEKAFEDLANGKVDIVIATHKLLNENIHFKNLGLLIVDEEHRFGVQQKEKIKKLALNVDILTLTATPIPRTLNLALAGTRDLSIIGTPPPKRRSVKTFIHEHNNGLIREAVMREILRGGQVYFLHNKVETIEAMAAELRKLLPEARITVGHGQLHERDLERVMADFYHQKFNVLVCSTIIESGIDVPTANTIIINRADKFGLAQLHQLRGRVGRSHHQAYAYLLTPPWKAMTADAQQRLEAFEALGDLGVGFSLATQDLEIRGAGEILGEQQSGHMQAIGFSLYMELLSDAVKSLKAGKKPNLERLEELDNEIKLGISALFPEKYIGDVHIRLTLYKRLATCETLEEIQSFKGELIDRFGLLPEPAQNLFELTKIKLSARHLGIAKIEMNKDSGLLHFNSKPNIDPLKIIKLVQTQPKIYKLMNSQTLKFMHTAKTAEEKLLFVEKLLSLLFTS